MEKIKHLSWRAGFGLRPEEWKAKQGLSVEQAVGQLFHEAGAGKKVALPPALDASLRAMGKEERKAVMMEQRQQVGQANIDWIMRMAGSRSSPLLEKMALFWHGHFACRPFSGLLAGQQLNTIYAHALGNFRELLLAIARDAAMIRFLNNQQNRKEKPNENFARELLELFTIGRGHYSEQDVKEAARAFTGWSSNMQGEFTFRARFHDYGPKTFFGKTGNFDGGDVIDMILEKRECARFIARKIYRFFVGEKVEEERLEELSRMLYESGYEIAPLMRYIFERDWFYEEAGSRIKSPVELIVGIMRSLDVRFVNERTLIFLQQALGQMLFKPPNVAGWPGGKAWIDNATLMLRLNLPAYLFQLSEVDIRLKEEAEERENPQPIRRLDATIDTRPLMDLLEGVPRQRYHEQLAEYLLAAPLKTSTPLIQKYADARGDWDYANALVMRLMSLPEYQLC